MSQHYTLAGPDIGIRRVDFAELRNEIGDDAAIDAVNAAGNGGVFAVPNSDPQRIVRSWKTGDDALGYEYFARKAGLTPEDRAEYRPEVETREEARSGLFAKSPNDAGLYTATVRVVTEVFAKVKVVAKDQAEATAALDAYVANKPMPEGFSGHINFPYAEVASGSHRALVKAEGDYDKAGWKLEITETPRRLTEAEIASFYVNLHVEQRVHEALASLV